MKTAFKKAALPIAVGVLSVASLPALADGPKFYGNFNVSVDVIDAEGAKTAGASFPGTADHVKVSSHNSRLGVTHEIGLDHGLTAVIKAEVKVNVDQGSSTIDRREIYAGVKGDFGQVIAGRINRPARTVEGRIDQFNHLYGDINTVLGGEGFSDNVVQYSAPKFGGFSAKIAYIAAEADDKAKESPITDLDDGVSASIAYENKNLYVALGYETNVKNPLAGIETAKDQANDALRFGIGYKIGNAFLGAIVQQQKGTEYFVSSGANDPVTYASRENEELAYIVNGAYTIDRVKLKAQYGAVEGDRTNHTRDYFAVGADYALGKGSYVYTTFTQINKDEVTAEKTDNIFQIGFNQAF